MTKISCIGAVLLWCLAMAMASLTELAFSQSGSGDSYFINCGGQGNVTVDSVQWQGDNSTPASSYIMPSSPSSQSIAAADTGSTLSSSSSSPSFAPLLNTSRIFNSTGGYSFPVSPGRYWVRLYFYPFSFQAFHPSNAIFSITAGSYTLLSNINIASAVNSSNGNDNANGSSSYLFKEYAVSLTDPFLVISFIPASSSSFAFINAVQVLPSPSNLTSDDTIPLGVNSPTPIGMPYMAMETMYRVNVGGPSVSPSNDSDDLFRTWEPNDSNLVSSAGIENYSVAVSAISYFSDSEVVFAPAIVYSTALQVTASKPLNMSWRFAVPADYKYVVRLHFCELVYAAGGKRHFNVYLQHETAYSSLDLGQLLGENRPYHVDFSLDVQGEGTLLVQAGPPPNPESGNFTQAILNGIEIWKLNNSLGSLDGQRHDGLATPSSGSKPKIAPIVGGVVGALAALGLLLLGICVCSRQRAKIVKQPHAVWLPLPIHGGHSHSVASKTTMVSGTGSYVSSAPSSGGRVFSFSEILDATQHFDESLVLGVGGFGKVYQGELDDGTKVAVKRGNPRSEQGITEFQTEIEMLSKLRHRHLVSLIGYCKENQEMVLVYEYMANGPLRSHLYGSDFCPLSWRRRLEICIGAARGLHYLHTGATQCIIHRDVKTTNILLDENLVAKVSDFGLSKTGPSLDRTHVTTAVKGSFGYLDPEYFRRQQLTDKSDVYSFGVVLLEVLCARPAINPALPRDEVNLAEWAMHWQSVGELAPIIDPHLGDSVSKESLEKFGETARKCLADEGINRPTIGEVLWNLEYALQLQETYVTQNAEEESVDQVSELPILHSADGQWEESMTVNHSFSGSEDFDGDDATVSAVFSEMLRPQGRQT